jgi:hypothetical protein
MSGKQVAVYKTFQEFYPFYLREHSEPTNRTLHFVGTSLVILLFAYIVLTGSLNLAIYIPLVGYGTLRLYRILLIAKVLRGLVISSSKRTSLLRSPILSSVFVEISLCGMTSSEVYSTIVHQYLPQ